MPFARAHGWNQSMLTDFGFGTSQRLTSDFRLRLWQILSLRACRIMSLRRDASPAAGRLKTAER